MSKGRGGWMIELPCRAPVEASNAIEWATEFPSLGTRVKPHSLKLTLRLFISSGTPLISSFCTFPLHASIKLWLLDSKITEEKLRLLPKLLLKLGLHQRGQKLQRSGWKRRLIRYPFHPYKQHPWNTLSVGISEFGLNVFLGLFWTALFSWAFYGVLFAPNFCYQSNICVRCVRNWRWTQIIVW